MANTITLLMQHNNEPREFEWNHAVRLLTQQQAKGFKCWKLPEDSPYFYTNGNIIQRPNKSRTRKGGERQIDPEGGAARDENQNAHGAGDGEG